MKFIILLLAVVLIALQVVVMLGVVELAAWIVTVGSIALAAIIGYIALRLPVGQAQAAAPKPAPIKESALKPAANTAKPVRAEAEIVAFLALLQEEGRLIDFAEELIDDASDEQVGAAARVVHAGCRKVFREYLELGPVRAEQEGAAVVLKADFDPSLYRLVGKVGDRPPYKGRLLHPGWAVRQVKLPQVTSLQKDHPWPVLAPAEVEVEGSVE